MNWPVGLAERPEPRPNEPVYIQARDGKWYPIRNSVTRELVFWVVKPFPSGNWLTFGEPFDSGEPIMADPATVVEAKTI